MLLSAIAVSGNPLGFLSVSRILSNLPTSGGFLSNLVIHQTEREKVKVAAVTTHTPQIAASVESLVVSGAGATAYYGANLPSRGPGSGSQERRSKRAAADSVALVTRLA